MTGASGDGALTHRQKVGLLVGALVIVAAWSVWALTLLPAQRSDAENLYRQLATQPAGGRRGADETATVLSVHARPTGISNVIPPAFEFEVQIDRSIGGKRQRATGFVSAAPGSKMFEYPQFHD